jgi:5-methylcytosine-specific restriction endonuclease McrA
MSQYIPEVVRIKVVERANFCCEYCLVHERYSVILYEVDHIVAIKHGGESVLENLAYSCQHCNRHKGTDLTTLLDGEDAPVRIFNPRKDIWSEHFEATAGAIYGKTLVGKATAKLLAFNVIERVIGRQVLQESGLYPSTFP